MRVEAVLFDVDGTLIDSVLAHATAWHVAFSKHHFDVDIETIRLEIGKGADIMVPDLLPDVKVTDELLQSLSDAHGKVFHAEHLPHIKGFSGVPELFVHLKRDGKKLVLASSAHGKELAHFKKIAGIADLNLPQASSDDVKHSKPHPDIFQKASKVLGGVEASKCVVVGDSPHDVRAARRAGMHVVGLLCGGFPEEMLRSAGCALIYRDIVALHAGYRDNHDDAFIGRVG